MKNRSILPAILLILAGLWFLAQNFGLRLPNLLNWVNLLRWDQIWPGFLILGGVMGLVSYFNRARRDPDRLFWEVAAIGLGCFFFLFTLRVRLPVFGRIEWHRMGEFWPGFLLVVSGAYLGQFALSGFRRRDALVSGVGAAAVGIVAFGFTLDLLSWTSWQQVSIWWPAALILVGLWLMIQTFVRRR